MELPVDAEIVLPHRGPMKLLDTLTFSKSDCGGAKTVIPKHFPFLTGESQVVHRFAMIELIAQSYAATKTYQDIMEGKKSRAGYLVGITKSTFYGDARVGDTLTVTVNNEEGFEDFYIARGWVKNAETLLLEAVLKIWLKPSENGL